LAPWPALQAIHCSAGTFAVAATILSSTFNWPDILREPPDVVLPEFVAGGTSLVWTWFAVAWTYAVLLVPILPLPAALGRRDDPVLRAATFVGAASVLLSLIGFLRWVFVVPSLADSYVACDATTKAAVAAAWMAQHQFGGALLGEHLGQLLAIGWSITVSLLILRTGILWRWVGWAGLVASVLYLTGQGTSWPPPSPTSRSGIWAACSAVPCGACGCSSWAWPCCEVRSAGPPPRRCRPRAAGADWS
jgi:hypothetical protein